ncbi:hypothetical protein C799_01288 [Bacteroides thetaiotaomicron dnLKV9]|jgi:hypothetical protein|uniref:Uncharacterized protein n=1 Tax=Bacteroides thetaiotaomicron dnLKV9 TaxID=1235785 RepID=R9HDV5_BACT4|nr:hypothetical protein C799_01288 [Bacteroides thetaiotaomicron dnLKV9]
MTNDNGDINLIDYSGITYSKYNTTLSKVIIMVSF